MKCVQVQKYIHAYLDGELGADLCADIEKHVDGCTRCREQMDFEAAFIDRVRSELRGEQAPPRLEADIRRALTRSDNTRRRSGTWRMVAGFAAAAALVVVAWLGLRPLVGGHSDELPAIPPLEEQVVENVVRNPPLELQNANEKEVTDWFRGKISFAVEPPRLASAGGQTEFVGARLYNVGESESAYLVYDVDGSKVTVQMFRSDRDGMVVDAVDRGTQQYRPVDGGWVTTTRGYTVGVVTHRGVTYSLTSAEMDEQSMAELISQIR